MKKLPSISKDLIATYAAQIWIAVTGVVFVPVYLRYLGIEAYGLIGLFATLQGMMVILDFGMAPTLTRELARFKGGEHDALHVRDLLRSVETAACTIALLAALGLWAMSGWLASAWFHSHAIPDAILARALTIIGVVVAARFVESLFRSALLGLQRQSAYNGIAAAVATLRAGGAALIVAFVSPTLDAFFLWQAFISVLSVAALAMATYADLPTAERAGRFSLSTLRSVWRFAAGMFGISILALLLTQVDKLLLSRLLSLADFGRFMLATVVASAIELLSGPILQVFGPRIFKFQAAGEDADFIALYHEGSQLITVLVGTPAVILIAFANTLLTAWTGDAVLADTIAPVLRILTLGYILNVLVRLPYQVQLAHHWLSLTLWSNVVAVILIIPALFWIVPHYGTTGAAWVWAALNAGYILITVQIMHSRILRTEKWRWYWQDVIRPIAAAGVVAMTLHVLFQPLMTTRFTMIAVLVAASGISLFAAILVSPLVRRQANTLLFFKKDISLT